jgi:hypothetical protein
MGRVYDSISLPNVMLHKFATAAVTWASRWIHEISDTRRRVIAGSSTGSAGGHDASTFSPLAAPANARTGSDSESDESSDTYLDDEGDASSESARNGTGDADDALSASVTDTPPSAEHESNRTSTVTNLLNLGRDG